MKNKIVNNVNKEEKSILVRFDINLKFIHRFHNNFILTLLTYGKNLFKLLLIDKKRNLTKKRTNQW